MPLSIVFYILFVSYISTFVHKTQLPLLVFSIRNINNEITFLKYDVTYE